MENRIEILKMSLYVEDVTSRLLAELLEIEDYKKSKSLYGNSSLSFNQKVNLLIDIGALEGDSRKLFVKFMEIRNVFMHNNDADTYVKCMANIEGAQKFLFNRYGIDDDFEVELSLEITTKQLMIDVCGYIERIIKIVQEKHLERKLAEGDMKIKKSLIEILTEAKDDADDFVKKMEDGAYFTKEGLDGLGKLVHSYVMKKLADKLGVNINDVPDNIVMT